MPCNTSLPFGSKNDYDKFMNQVIRHLLFIYNQLDIFPPKELTKAYTQKKFTNKDGDYWTEMLCERISKMSKENKKIVLHKKDSKKSKKLLEWWEKHQKMDNNI